MQQRISTLWKSGIGGKLTVVGVPLLAGCCLCLAVIVALPTPSQSNTPSASRAPATTEVPHDATVIINVPTATNAPTTAPTAVLGVTRDKPLPVDATVDIGGGMEVSIIFVTRPANDIVVQGNMFNDTPEPNSEYLIVRLHVECTKPTNDKCSFSYFEFKTVGADGQVHDTASVAGIPGAFESFAEFFGGASIEGSLVYLATKDDPSLVLFYDPLFLGEPIYIALQ
jgi:hypothetical protein